MTARWMRHRRARRILAAIAAVAVLGVVAGASGSRDVEAQQPVATPTPGTTQLERQALSIERQLLCPVCTNERLDVCSTAVCTDMKRVIRTRLEAGATPDDIILYFETRYGSQVRAELPPSGFNLLLFGWVGGALLLTAAAAALMLISMRRASMRRRAAATGAAATPPDDRWLDAQIHEGEAAQPPDR
ncbi:MAG: cytochrome c-type biogenesis protein CcmH [Dehalococcoidia bacterium]